MRSRLLGLVPVAALTALLPALVLAAPPAQAVVTGTTSSSDVALRNKCVNHPIHYTVLVDPGTLLWKLKLTVVSPGGRTSEGIDLSSTADPTTGTVNYLICGSYSPGTYTVHGVGGYQVVPLVNIAIPFADSTFDVRRAATRTTLGKTHLRGDRYRLVARVKDERRQGFRPTSNAEVVLERRVGDTWKVIRGSRAQTDHGVATTTVEASPGTRVRAVTRHAGYLGGSTSKPVALNP